MKKLEFTRDVFDGGVKIFSRGQQVDPTSSLQKHVRRGNAKLVEVEEKKPAAPASGGKDAGDGSQTQASATEGKAAEGGADADGKGGRKAK